MTENTENVGHLWAIHSDKNGMPVLRAWAKSEADANAKLNEIKSSDAAPEDSYWVTQLLAHQIEALKGNGFIPGDA